eukprot:CAMPEP_0117511568 /NCGR_PEP_ID=MMETSP0784-20121206/28577_1 /TAXON_ID=39447 /ORGANISM="" /LENGTH=48 /DNA_ID= /DNA_START= /DNA_END= /DNA_ORIENTATION=
MRCAVQEGRRGPQSGRDSDNDRKAKRLRQPYYSHDRSVPDTMLYPKLE